MAKEHGIPMLEIGMNRRASQSGIAPATEAEPVYQWRRKRLGDPWHDASHNEAYSREDDDYEARTLYILSEQPTTHASPCARCETYQFDANDMQEQFNAGVATGKDKIAALEEDRDTWKERAEFSYRERDKLEAEIVQLRKAVNDSQTACENYRTTIAQQAEQLEAAERLNSQRDSLVSLWWANLPNEFCAQYNAIDAAIAAHRKEEK